MLIRQLFARQWASDTRRLRCDSPLRSAIPSEAGTGYGVGGAFLLDLQRVERLHLLIDRFQDCSSSSRVARMVQVVVIRGADDVRAGRRRHL